MTPETRRTAIKYGCAVIVTLIVCAAVTGNFDMLLGLFEKTVK